MNSHYVPRLVLRKFKDKLSLYNVKTGEFREEIKIENAYAEQNFYNDETEKNLATMLEGPFGNLLANKLLKCQGTVELSHKELNLIKKFLLLSVLRSYGADKFMLLEKNFYINQQKNSIEYWRKQGLSEDEIQERIEVLKPPFEEKQIEGETLTQYWLRTLNVVLETDGTSEEILKHENKTYPAYRWAKVIESGYLAFWDSNSSRDEFVITDVGMTSENEIGWNGITVHNQKKTDFYALLFSNETDSYFQQVIARYLQMNIYFHENFQMFPISANRMIVLIAPFYKFRQEMAGRYPMLPLRYLTRLSNEELFERNTVEYYLKQPKLSTVRYYHEKDKYIYQIKKLKAEEVRYCNALFMDRIDTYLGFSSLNKVVRSIVLYKRLNEYPYTPRVDYTELYKIIQERYGGNIGV